MIVGVVVAHPDDEVLGVGGTIARHVEEGDDVRVVIACQNSFRGHLPEWRIQACASLKTLGVTRFSLLGWPDQKLDQLGINGVVLKIAEAMHDIPQIWYTHWHKDLNRDHRVVNEAVQLIARPKQGHRFEVREFPTPSSTEYSREVFTPDTWVALTAKQVQKKNEALACYENDLQPYHLPRNGRGMNVLAISQGNQVGVEAAEIFETARRVL